MALAREALALLSLESCLPWSLRYLPDAHLSVYQLALALDCPPLAEQSIRQACRYALLLQGPSGPDYKAASAHLKRMLR